MPRVAYFSPEFGVGAVLPQYSGGLGVLAGDHLKAASDLGLDLIGVGLFYREGYFRQILTATGRQLEEYPDLDPELLPMRPAVGADGAPVRIQIALPGATLHAAVWRVDVGRVPLLMLDSDVPENAPAERATTDRLYGGDREHRLRQEILLGIGGVRALAALGIEPEIYHSNEGHAGFMGLERMRVLIEEEGVDASTAFEAVRAGTVFTTHTPVPAGIDRFPRDLVARYFGDGGVSPGLPLDRMLHLGEEPNDAGTFNMAVMGIRLAGHVNGVSRLHGAVSRSMFADLWPGFDAADVPIAHVTNGIHAETWVGPEMDELFRSKMGDGYGVQGHGWHVVGEASDDELWSARRAARNRLVHEVRRRVGRIWEGRGLRGGQLGWVGNVLDPEALTVGFARRVPTYKRLTLMLLERERLERLLTDRERPLQIVLAGKSHPADEEGKRLIAELGAFAARPEVRHRIVLLPDYDMALARALVTGADVWLNNPLRPFEACGTSGMKVSMNGGLNLSILDGWWDELYDGMNGFAIPSADDGSLPPEERDRVEAAALLDLLEHVVVPRFYDRPDGLPRAWLSMVRHTLTQSAPQLLATRMVRDYVEQVYAPAARVARRLASDGHAGAAALGAWKARVREAFPGVAVESVEADPSGLTAGDQLVVRVRVRLGGLASGDLRVEAVYGRPEDGTLTETAAIILSAVEEGDGVATYQGAVVLPPGPFGLGVRVLPYHPDLAVPADMRLIASASLSGRGRGACPGPSTSGLVVRIVTCDPAPWHARGS